jgi:hypothetical protein
MLFQKKMMCDPDRHDVPSLLVPEELTAKHSNWSFSDVSAQLCWNHRRETGSLDDCGALQPWFLANTSVLNGTFKLNSNLFKSVSHLFFNNSMDHFDNPVQQI